VNRRSVSGVAPEAIRDGTDAFGDARRARQGANQG
jgi:hypothetical protein